MLTYMHQFIFPTLGGALGKFSTIVNMPWNDGLRYLFNLQNLSGIDYWYTNLYTGVKSSIDWSTRLSINILNVFNEVLYQLIYPLVSPIIPVTAPVWVAFLYIVIVVALGFFILKFFIGLFI